MNRLPATEHCAPRPRRTFRVALSSCVLMLFACAASAQVAIPDQPLIIGSRIPPNLLFLLDNSGSMQWDYLPDDAPSGWMRQTAIHNKIYYDPSVTYMPWVDSTGATMTGGQNYRSAYDGTNRIPPFDNDTIDLQSDNRTFYVVKNPLGDLRDQSNYWRYQIRQDGAVIRSEQVPRAGSPPKYNEGLPDRGCTSGNSSSGWRNCTRETPDVAGRSESEELQNFATWYSYHRTRYKVAKSSVGRAFAEIGSEYRVGYRNIWNDMPISGSSGGINWANHPISRAKPIPVGRNKGLFNDPNGVDGANNNKTAWYQRLYAETGTGSTPLREALYQAGEYFETDRTSTGPWGEGGSAQGDQFACRLNYTILTTDGYRNDGNWNKVGEEDNSDGPLITSPMGASYQYRPSRPYASSHSGNLGDIAMRYWKRDLRPDLDNVVPMSPANPAFWQHMVTFGISLGAAGTLDPEQDLPSLTSGAKPWPFHWGYQQGSNSGAESIDDLWHAAVNSRGTFVMANNADEFSRALKNALSEIASRDSSFSNVASNSVSLETGTRVFNASYVTGTWTGALTARAITALGVSAAPSWTASLPSDWSQRKVFTSELGSGVAFPAPTQLLQLGRSGGTLNFPVTALNNANYLKGDDSREQNRGGTLRNRSTKLGDIIGSSPAYVKETETIYVGANDGMLHAFNALNGAQIFSYIPGIVDVGLLSTLSRGDYDHKFFVDGPVVVSDRAKTDGQNLLIGALGRGGKGLFALDVTNPQAATAVSVFKWERANTPSGHMGMVLGKPFFAAVQGRSGAVAVVGNGINSTSNKAALIVLDAASGSVVAEIDTGVGSSAEPNGLSAPTGVYGADGRTLAYVYAGDLRGNVWKFDLTSGTPGAWTVARVFTAVNDTGGVQPISGALAVATHPTTRKRWIFFGTGRYLTAGDVSTAGAGVQSMYALIEDGTTIARTSLTRRGFELTDEFSNGYPVRAFEASAALPAGSKGWFVNLPESGERIIQDAQMVSSLLVTASMIPSSNACNPDGIGYINALDAFTGASAKGSYFDLDGDGSTADSTIGTNSRPVGSVNVGGGMPTLPNLLRGVLVVGGTGSGNLRSIQTRAPRWERASWREVRRD